MCYRYIRQIHIKSKNLLKKKKEYESRRGTFGKKYLQREREWDYRGYLQTVQMTKIQYIRVQNNIVNRINPQNS